METLPRWDDICCVVLGLGAQNGLLRHLGAGEEVRSPRPARPRSTVSIQPCKGLGRSIAASEIVFVLRALGLVDDRRWTAAAELVFWRQQPRPWSMDVLTDPRFRSAVADAAATIPADLRASVDRLVAISDNEIAQWIDRATAHRAADPPRLAEVDAIDPALTVAQALKRIAEVRDNRLDWLFFRRWRLREGWLTPEQAATAIAIFHDPLAMAVRQGVVASLCPDAPGFST